MKIAFLTSGGLAPCLSASIGALVAEYSVIAPEAKHMGYLNGYRGLLLGQSIDFPDSDHAMQRMLLCVRQCGNRQSWCECHRRQVQL